ncbi:sensor domain-containing phosphodiesterase [Catellatospora paridis]|uniref:sensor domain-containing phosphodiesterase n=1 Tax=Catellatospora paridis TaxID=1617086 RepID=UPI0012D3BB19|nr:EAL domain-containing protein [Catellatospora paridis]
MSGFAEGGERSDAEFDALLSGRAIYPVFQPIVALAGRNVVGYEALARGPAGSAFEFPAALFSHAQRAGRVGELDWAARAAAFHHALAAVLPYEVPLFVNTEPSTLRTACPPDLISTVDVAVEKLQIVFEITERSLGDDPAALLMLMARVRARSARIALDDVGVNPASLALMSLLHPDVIKLDGGLVRRPMTEPSELVVKAVQAESARTGAVVLAEGIETEGHLQAALSLGATLGQGWLFGHPGPLPARHERPGAELPRNTWLDTAARTPFEVASRHHAASPATEDLLNALSTRMEAMAARAPESMVMLATFMHVKYLTETISARFAARAADGALTAVFARDMPPRPAAGVQGVALGDDDPLTGEWTVIIVDSYFAGGLFARRIQTPDHPPGCEFEMILSYDRALVTEAAQSLMKRLTPGP